MKTAKQERRGWVSYALAAGFVLLASGAVLPHADAAFSVVVREVRALFS